MNRLFKSMGIAKVLLSIAFPSIIILIMAGILIYSGMNSILALLIGAVVALFILRQPYIGYKVTKKKKKMKKILLFLMAIMCLTFTSCKEHFSDGERVGTVTKFSKAGVFWDSWDGLLNVTQTGMNSSGEPFTFSMDNDRNDQQRLIDTLVKAQVEGWKVKIKYHQVWGAKNVFNNRGESDYFVDDVIVLDKNFSKIGDIVKGTNKTASHDTLYVKIVE